MATLVTGGAGYIGSHAALRLLREGERVVVLDNLSRGHAGAIEAVSSAAAGLTFVRGDVGDRGLVDRVLEEHGIDAVLHFAALAYVGESVEKPLLYYRNNSSAALVLIEACVARGVGRFVFSSTCATYGEPDRVPIVETCPQSPINPYGRSKLHVEHMLRDAARASGGRFAFAALRYFNVAGCDRTGLLGEHHEPETHLVPVVLQAALGQRDHVAIFGTDYPTPDGTCIRDYIHVEDLVDAHVRVLGALGPGEARAYNLGIGRGVSVREMIEAARRVTGREIRVKEGPRREGDPARLFADPGLIRNELGWSASITGLEAIIESAWRWFRDHPRGYAR